MRVVAPLSYRTRGGRTCQVPVGPCLVECASGQPVAIVRGISGIDRAALPPGAIDAAQHEGRLIVLD